MSKDNFRLLVEDSIAHLQFNRPERLNTMDTGFWKQFPAMLDDLATRDDIRALVISSTGKHFSAGMDLSVFTNPDVIRMNGEPARVGEKLRRLVLELQDCFNRLEKLRFPVLAAIQGGCIGGALDLCAACDMRFCTADAFFSIRETRLGMTADLGTLQRLPHLVPQGLLRELAYTGRDMDSNEAFRIGLVNRVFECQDSMLAAVLDMAREIAGHSPLAITGTKQMINYSRDHSLSDSLDMMATWQAGMFRPEDLMRGLQAHMSKQAPTYRNLATAERVFGPVKTMNGEIADRA
jgi:enoyl-CoA hydratase